MNAIMLWIKFVLSVVSFVADLAQMISLVMHIIHWRQNLRLELIAWNDLLEQMRENRGILIKKAVSTASVIIAKVILHFF
jgi:hypothetical protein